MAEPKQQQDNGLQKNNAMPTENSTHTITSALRDIPAVTENAFTAQLQLRCHVRIIARMEQPIPTAIMTPDSRDAVTPKQHAQQTAMKWKQHAIHTFRRQTKADAEIIAKREFITAADFMTLDCKDAFTIQQRFAQTAAVQQ